MPLQDTLQSIVRARRSSGYRKWGFVIFRGTHKDKLWQTFMTLLEEGFAAALQRAELYDELWPDLLWTVIENRETLENAPKDLVRNHFLEWVAARSEERDGPGATQPDLRSDSPRFRYCLYVDEACLTALTVSKARPPRQRALRGHLIIIDGTHGHHYDHLRSSRLAQPDDAEDEDEDDDDGSSSGSGVSLKDGYAPIEGNREMDVGWTYIDVLCLLEQYAQWLYAGSDWEKWHWVYRGWSWRPERQPEPCPGEPLSVLDLAGREV